MTEQKTALIDSRFGRKGKASNRRVDGIFGSVADRAFGYPGRQAMDFLDLSGSELLIEAGSGSGFYTFQIAERLKYGKILALDRSSAMLAKLSHRVLRKNLSRRIEVLECDICDVPLADESADAAVCLFGWRNSEDPGKAASELYRLIKPGGKVFVADFRRDRRDASSRREFAAQDMKILLEDAGFSGIRAFLHQQKIVIGTAVKFS